MKITIDTSVDSKEDIRKVVALLSSLIVRGVEKHRNIFEESSPGLNVLDQRSPTQQEASQATDSDIGNAFTSLFGSESKPGEKKEEKEDIDLIPY